MLDQPQSDFIQIPVKHKSALLDNMCKLKSGENNGLVLTGFKHYVIYLHNKNNSEKLG